MDGAAGARKSSSSGLRGESLLVDGMMSLLPLRHSSDQCLFRETKQEYQCNIL
jgi:hypothetical protein